MIHLALPYPVSANKYWRSLVIRGSVRVLVSSEAKAYKATVGWMAKAQGVRTVSDKPVSLRVTLVPKNGIVMDLDNCLKVTLDALKGIVFTDDKQVREIHASYAPADGKGGLLVEISAIEPVKAQADLLEA